MAIKKHSFWILAAAFVLAAWLLFWWQKPARPLIVSAHPWPGYEPLFLAENFGWLPPNVTLQRGRNASQSLKMLESGLTDMAALTLDEALGAIDRGMNLKIVAVLDESLGADVVIAHPHVSGLDDLTGRTIALEESTVSTIVLEQLLAQTRLSRADVKLTYLSPDLQPSRWDLVNYDLAVTYEPFATELLQKGGQVVFDSRSFPGMIYDVLVIRGDLPWRQQLLATDVIAAHFRAVDYIRINREDALRRIAAWRSISFQEMQRIFAGLYLPDLEFNKQLLQPNGPMTAAVAWIQEKLLHRPVGADGPDFSAIHGRLLPSERK